MLGRRLSLMVERPLPLSVAVGRFDEIDRRGITGVIAEDGNLQVVGENLDVDSLATSGAAVVLVDRLAAYGDVLPRLRSVQPTAGVIVLARSPGRPFGRTLVACGVSCVDWTSSAAELIAAIHTTALGEATFLAAWPSYSQSDRTAGGQLTEKELVVLALVSAGESTQAIASQLHLSASTVRTYLGRLVVKLEAQSRRDLVGLPTSLLSAS